MLNWGDTNYSRSVYHKKSRKPDGGREEGKDYAVEDSK